MRRTLGLLILIVWSASWAGPAAAQEAISLNVPVTALYAEGDRLLIGQGTRLVEAQVTADAVTPRYAVDVGRHEIRSLTIRDGITLALSEDGLTTLNATGKILDYAQGGGQRVAVKQSRVYIAALDVGIRLLQIGPGGKLSPTGVVGTLGPAADIAPEGDSWVWVAEGQSGVRLYDTSDPKSAKMLLWLGNLTPAASVRVNGPRLFVGHGHTISIVDTVNVQLPRLLTAVDMPGAESQTTDLVIQKDRAFVGRVAESGPDVVSVNITAPKSAALVARFGDTGSGQHIAILGTDLFIGSLQSGLRRVRFGADNPTLIEAWDLPAGDAPCSLSPPTDPRPANLGAANDLPISLTWKVACSASRYEIRINGVVAGEVTSPAYSISPQPGTVTWQVTAIDQSGRRVEGPVWSFEMVQEGWLATPVRMPTAATLYRPSATPFNLNSPGAIIAATCGLLIAGLLVVVGGAWGIGALAERRARNREI